MQRGFSWSAFVWKTTLILIPIITAGLLLWLRHVEVRALAQRTVSSYGAVPNFELVNQAIRLRAVSWKNLDSGLYLHELSRALPDDQYAHE